MKISVYFLVFSLVLSLVLYGCALSESPVQTENSLGTQTVNYNAGSHEPVSVGSSRFIWGIWDITIDLESLTAEISTYRSTTGHFNILPFLTPPACTDCMLLHVNSYDAVSGIIDLDVTLRNKFAISGYDVRGIVFTNDLGHLLVNEDAWTSLYDIPGGDGVSPFKAFAKTEPQRKFEAKGQHTENYKIWCPNPPKFLQIKYAVDASYPANCPEPYAMENFTQQTITTENGSSGEVTIDVKDWQGDVSEVTVSAPGVNNSPVAMTHLTGDTWSCELINLEADVAGDYQIGFKAKSSDSGTLSLDYFTTITISDVQPKVGWARTWGGEPDDWGQTTIVDKDGNILIAGFYRGDNVDFDPDPVKTDLHTANYADVFLSKFDSSGNYLWSRVWGGDGYDFAAGLTADGSGNIYLIGTFDSPVIDMDPSTGEDIHYSNGQYDVFLSVITSDGNYVKSVTWGGDESDYGEGVFLDNFGYLYAVGSFSKWADFDPGAGFDEYFANAATDVFVSQFDTSLNYYWARVWGGSDTQWGDRGYGVGVDADGGVYVSGYFFGTNVDFDPGPAELVYSSYGAADCFLSKFDSSGNLIWANTWGGDDFDFGYDCVVNSAGNVYMTGNFASSSVDFDPGIEADIKNSNGDYDAFVTKFNALGQYQWCKTWGGADYDSGYGITLDKIGNVLITGQFSKNNVDFDPGPGSDPHSSNGWMDSFLSKFNSSGTFQWARTWGGSEQEFGMGVSSSFNNQYYVSGYFESYDVDFDPGDTQDIHSTNGIGDIFLIKFDTNGNW